MANMARVSTRIFATAAAKPTRKKLNFSSTIILCGKNVHVCDEWGVSGGISADWAACLAIAAGVSIDHVIRPIPLQHSMAGASPGLGSSPLLPPSDAK